MAQLQKITKAQLSELVEPALQHLLAGTGWSITDSVRRWRLPSGITADYWVAVCSGPARAALAVEVEAHPRPTLLKERAMLLRQELSQAELGVSTSVAFFVPHVTPALARTLRDAEAGYFDLFGACYLRWPGLFIDRPAQDRPIVSQSRGPMLYSLELEWEATPQAEGVFGSGSPKRHRVLRSLLSYPDRRWHQTELAREAGVSLFTAHSLVQFLLAEYYADYEGRGPEKRVFLVRPGELLETWLTFWRGIWSRMMRERAAWYYSLAVNVGEVRKRLEETARQVGGRLGFTLAAGANQYGAYLRDEAVHAYLVGSPTELAAAADLEPVRSGANVVLLVAQDPGVLYLPRHIAERIGVQETAVASPVCPVQLYLDMKAAGGRYAKQADRLREEVIGY